MYWEQMVYAPNQKILLKSEAPTSSWSKTSPNFTDSEEKMGRVAKKSAERLDPPADFYAFTEYPDFIVESRCNRLIINLLLFTEYP